MHKLLVILALLLLTGCAGTTGAFDDSVEIVESDNSTADPVQEIATEFKSLRTVRGHFDGGSWNEDLDEWMGRKHYLMIQLGSLLGAGDYGKAQVLQLLDPPDLVVHQGDDLFDQVNSLAEFERPSTGSYELLIYYWRGPHDYLYFTSQDGAIISSGWWYAGD